MKQLSRMKFTLALYFLLTGLLPSGSFPSFAATAPKLKPVLLYADEEVEMAKQQLMAIIYECMEYLSTLRGVLEAKATKDEAPELYARANDIAARIDYARYQIEQITTMDDVRALEAMVTDIREQIADLKTQIEEFEVAAIPENAIDLGLPSGTKWAPWNVGASKPEGYGGYYAWGETEVKEIYYTDTYIYDDKDLGIDIAGTDYDVAHVKWGGLWTMPTRDQMEELRVNCNSEWTTVNGIEGRKFTGPNGNSIFMPAAGIRQYDRANDINKGMYWSSSNGDQKSYRYELSFDSTECKMMWCIYYLGLPIRPVISGSNIVFADANVKAICVENWDTDGDGELSYDEAAAVTDIGQIFKDNKEITSFNELQFFTGLTSIPSQAFYGCNLLNTISLPNTIKTIDSWAFALCYKLNTISLSTSLTTIGELAFYYCDIKSIVIPQSVTSIVYNPFWCCNLVSIAVEEGNTVYDSRNDCNAVIETANNHLIIGLSTTVIPNTVTSIGYNAFNSGFAYMDTPNIPSSVTTIENNAFFGNYFKSLFIHKNIKKLTSHSFAASHVLESIVVEEGNTNYDSRDNCNAIIETATNTLLLGCKNTIIPNAVTSIASRAFYSSDVLTSITIPKSVTSIGYEAFNFCRNLVKVTSLIEEPFAIGTTVFARIPEDATLYVPAGTKALYEATEGWNLFQNIVEMSGNEMNIPDEAIDLGLPSGTKWSPWNVGASKPEDYGDYYAWGETDTKDYYSFENYSLCDDGDYLSCHDIGSDISGTEYDAAFVNWGKKWRMPTNSEMDELFACDKQWITKNGVEGILITGPNGNTLFLPAAGWYNGHYMHAEFTGIDFSGDYWTSTLYPTQNYSAYSRYFYRVNEELKTRATNHNRKLGLPVRPVISGNTPSGNIVFADATVKQLCVENWDTDGDNELSYAEAEAVTDLGQVFAWNNAITSFEELRFFTGLNSVSQMAFCYCTNLSSIVLPDNVTTIENAAFMGCTVLTSLTIPNSVQTICYAAYQNSGLVSLTIPKSVTLLQNELFNGCNNLAVVVVEEGNPIYDSRDNCNAVIQTAFNTLLMGCNSSFIPNSVTDIAEFAFRSCSGLTDIVIPNGVASIGDFAFQNCSALTSIIIPKSVTKISHGVFAGCSNLTSIVVEEGNPEYDSRMNCNALIHTSTDALIAGCQNTSVPEGVKIIGDDAFNGCTELIAMALPQTVINICDRSFDNCKALKSIELPSGLKSIGNSAFSGCTSLTMVTLPSSITHIDSYAFYNCELKEIVSEISEPFAIDDNVFSYYSNGIKFTSATLHVPAGTKALYEATEGWNLFQNIVEMKVGDVNFDGQVGIGDIVAVTNVMAGTGGDGFPDANADVNGDGQVGIGDIVAITNIMAGIGGDDDVAYLTCPDDHHPHMIDLGLPSGTKWACCNVGASTPEEYGNYYAWGETQEKSVYDWETYQYGSSWDNVVNIGSDIAGTSYDAAKANWGAPWRIPSLTQIQELLNNCSSTWTTQNGVNGRKFVGPNGGAIFLPATGRFWDDSLFGAGEGGNYWSSTIFESLPYRAYNLGVVSEDLGWYNNSRSDGHSVRPVR